MHELAILMEKHGIKNQREIVRALQENGYFTESRSETLRAYVNQVIHGRRPASNRLKEGISLLCNNDPEVLFYFGVKSYNLEFYILKEMDKGYKFLRNRLKEGTKTEKLVIARDFEEFIKKYLSKPISQDEPA